MTPDAKCGHGGRNTGGNILPIITWSRRYPQGRSVGAGIGAYVCDVGAILGLSLPILAHLCLLFERPQSPKKGQWPAECQCRVN